MLRHCGIQRVRQQSFSNATTNEHDLTTSQVPADWSALVRLVLLDLQANLLGAHALLALPLSLNELLLSDNAALTTLPTLLVDSSPAPLAPLAHSSSSSNVSPSTAPPSSSASVVALRSVDAARCRLQSLPPTLHRCASIVRLDLSRNALRDVGALVCRVPSLSSVS